MNEDQFWEIVESTKAAADGSYKAHAANLLSHLGTLEPKEIEAFEQIFDQLTDRAYSWDLGGAAFLIRGGCSDDSFSDFRRWLISMGRTVYERALADPESLADLELGADADVDGQVRVTFEEFGCVAARAYRAKVGKEMPIIPGPYTAEPSGESFEEESDAQARRYPRLFAKYGYK
jgi:hypothetical protein